MAFSFHYDSQHNVVQTDRGKVRGYDFRGIHIFKGIPYARADRFHAPEPLTWKDTLDCTSFGYVCSIPDIPKPEGEVFVPHRYWPMSENCQNLNIWTPALDGAKRPVVVWLHGGGYENGSAIEHIAYEGENMARFGDCVSVSVNHRLNVLGYFDLSAFGDEYENSGNAGGDDIIAALRFIHDNIAAFGGDPGNVTVFGQSGGGGKVTTLLQSPEADGLYHRGVVMSGVIGTLLPDCSGSGEEFARAMMKVLGVSTVREMEKVPYAELARAYTGLRPVFEKAGKTSAGVPFRNSHYLGDPVQVGFRPETAQIPLIVGSVFGEFTSFAPFGLDKDALTAAQAEEKVCGAIGKENAEKLLPMFEKAYPERSPLDLLNLDFVFRLPEIGYVKKRSALNRCTRSYLFNQDFCIDGGRTPWHCADIPFVFHNTEFTPYAQIEGVTEKLESRMFSSLMAFARNGDPNNAEIPEWPADTPEKEQVMLFSRDTEVRVNFDHELIPAAEPVLKKWQLERMAQAQIQH
ncbi:MAG: carboxylesterase/lipase family protein [Lachnospiraceae bacterium]